MARPTLPFEVPPMGPFLVVADDWPGVTFDRVDAVVNGAPGANYFASDPSDYGYDAGYADPMGVTFDRIDAFAYWEDEDGCLFSGIQYIPYDTSMDQVYPAYPYTIVSQYVEDWRFFV